MRRCGSSRGQRSVSFHITGYEHVYLLVASERLVDEQLSSCSHLRTRFHLLESALGRPTEALERARAAMTMMVCTLGAEHPGGALVDLGRSANALSLLERALRILRPNSSELLVAQFILPACSQPAASRPALARSRARARRPQ
jgi:hypothetical protein